MWVRFIAVTYLCVPAKRPNRNQIVLVLVLDLVVWAVNPFALKKSESSVVRELWEKPDVESILWTGLGKAFCPEGTK